MPRKTYNPRTSNNYPNDGRQFVLHVSGAAPREVCMHGGKLVEVMYNPETGKPFNSSKTHDIDAGYRWSHCAA